MTGTHVPGLVGNVSCAASPPVSTDGEMGPDEELLHCGVMAKKTNQVFTLTVDVFLTTVVNNIQFVPQVLLVLLLPSLIAHTCCQFINQELGFEKERRAFEKDRLRFEKERSTLMEGMHQFEGERHSFLLKTQHLQNEVDKQKKEIAQHLLTINK